MIPKAGDEDGDRDAVDDRLPFDVLPPRRDPLAEDAVVLVAAGLRVPVAQVFALPLSVTNARFEDLSQH